MARHAGLGLVGLFMVFFGVLLAAPYVRLFFPNVSGFNDMSCQQGAKPCPEGYFCEKTSCVPILPRYNIANVKGCDNC